MQYDSKSNLLDIIHHFTIQLLGVVFNTTTILILTHGNKMHSEATSFSSSMDFRFVDPNVCEKKTNKLYFLTNIQVCCK